MQRGKFIVFEGLDGSGKSTHMKLFSQALTEMGIPNQTTCQPSGGEIGRLIRRALACQISLQPHTLAYLFAADRYEHIISEVIPALESGINVICDRYYFSNFAYQREAADLDTLIAYNKPSMELLRPDIVLYMDLGPAICIERMAGENRGDQIFEKLETLTEVKKAYFSAFERLKDEENIVIIDCDRDVREVANHVLSAVKEIFI